MLSSATARASGETGRILTSCVFGAAAAIRLASFAGPSEGCSENSRPSADCCAALRSCAMASAGWGCLRGGDRTPSGHCVVSTGRRVDYMYVASM